MMQEKGRKTKKKRGKILDRSGVPDDLEFNQYDDTVRRTGCNKKGKGKVKRGQQKAYNNYLLRKYPEINSGITQGPKL